MIEDAGGVEGYEFQRLHGMGEVLYEPCSPITPRLPAGSTPGRRSPRSPGLSGAALLENGANSSFVSVAADPSVPIASILRRPQSWIGDPAHACHPKIPLPHDLYAPERVNSSGVEFGDRASLGALLAQVRSAEAPTEAAPLIDGVVLAGSARPLRSPIDAATIGRVREADAGGAAAAMAAAQRAFPPGPRRRSRPAPPRSNAPAISWRRGAAG